MDDDDDDDDEDDGEISFRRSFHSAGATISKQQVGTPVDARRSVFGREGAFFTANGEAAQSVEDERVPLESSTLGSVGDITFACGSASGSTLLPISKAFIQERIDHSSRNTSSWSVSSDAQERQTTKAFRGGKMMGQYLQQSRRTASQTDVGLGLSPLLPVVPLSTWSAGGNSNSHGSLVQGGPLCIPRITVNGAEYGRVFEQLVKKTLQGHGGSGSALAGAGSGSGSGSCSGGDDGDVEEYGIETMCPVSLEGLVYADNEEEEDEMVGGERGDRVMEVALADSTEIRGIDMSFLPSLIRQDDASVKERPPVSRCPPEMDRGQRPAPKKNSAGSISNNDMGHRRAGTGPRMMGSSTAAILHARAPPLPPAPKAAPPTLPIRS
ncbi:hypothetical protein BGZ70_004968 [Mortierella alpina]|uniref:Uncharacterized protein n=1 Tax=Mortierella alpina TaxID=64518 RepID=A0A9P6M4P8_MORAP|nr:hypothetical protein BGZ70_004968 [Mortierella alpina]